MHMQYAYGQKNNNKKIQLPTSYLSFLPKSIPSNRPPFLISLFISLFFITHLSVKQFFPSLSIQRHKENEKETKMRMKGEGIENKKKKEFAIYKNVALLHINHNCDNRINMEEE